MNVEPDKTIDDADLQACTPADAHRTESVPADQLRSDPPDTARKRGKPKLPQNDPTVQRKARAAQKLKENLLRRKQQSRARRAGDADEGFGLPAAKTTEDAD
ncbi:MAG: hypothetical protein ACOH2J_14205 [Allorhizobium sp.]